MYQLQKDDMKTKPRSTRVKAPTDTSFVIDVNPLNMVNEVIAPKPTGRDMIDNKDKQSQNKPESKTQVISHKKNICCNIQCEDDNTRVSTTRTC